MIVGRIKKRSQTRTENQFKTRLHLFRKLADQCQRDASNGF
ncbi:hypothetical protein CA54_11960 [Symmachiella macrocystis]|uniref:Uncharacterized protein n=1 Tax=Symmachiella macrocystis TaxID=2527985 RepID=A0A5C6BKU5_9PLAN|nr:hypothetical protein CA54_11960 [Symmachiella macrocystis]